ncbi:MAG: TIGR02530 family flagellar biosynthesis protein [Sporomusaceae bacterium]|nr:TIGR02530 family flagellar biosynthesis protein [Sporomusaceae bacterium]
MADSRIFYANQPVFPLTPAAVPVKTQSTSASSSNQDFSKILNEKISGVKFSQHAMERLQSRNIELSTEDLQKLSSAVEKAEKKGAKESLMVLNNLAFVVSVKNRTVITAMDGQSMKDNVFTNIDSAVLLT